LHQKSRIALKDVGIIKTSIVMFWLGLGLMIFGAVVIWAAFSVVSMILSVIVEFIQEIIFG
jgi:hypothetical protein